MRHQTCGNGRTRQTASPCLSSEDSGLEITREAACIQTNREGPTALQPPPVLPELAWGGAPGPSNSCSSAGRLCTAGHGSLQHRQKGHTQTALRCSLRRARGLVEPGKRNQLLIMKGRTG